MKKTYLLTAMLSALCFSACSSDPVVSPDDIPPLHSETGTTETTDPALTGTRPFTTPESVPDTTANRPATGYTFTTLSDTSVTTLISLTTVSGTGTTVSTSSGQTTSSTSTITTLTTTSLTTTAPVPLQQVFTAIAGEWYIDGEVSKGKVIIAANGVFTAYDGKNKVTAVGQAKHEYVTNAAGTQEPRYNLYNKFGNNVVLSITDTGAAKLSELASTIDGKTTYYTPKGKGFQMPNEADRKKTVEAAMDAITTLETLASGDFVIDSADQLPSNTLYNKVITAPVESAQAIRKLLDEKLSGIAKARYNGLVSGDMPQFLDVNGAFYALPVTRKADFSWIDHNITLGETGDRMFTASAQYIDPNNAAQTASMTFRFEDNVWKLITLE